MTCATSSFDQASPGSQPSPPRSARASGATARTSSRLRSTSMYSSSMPQAENAGKDWLELKRTSPCGLLRLRPHRFDALREDAHQCPVQRVTDDGIFVAGVDIRIVVDLDDVR